MLGIEEGGRRETGRGGTGVLMPAGHRTKSDQFSLLSDWSCACANKMSEEDLSQ